MLAIYSAGYARTRAAAEKLSQEDHRRPSIPAPAESGPTIPMPEPPAPRDGGRGSRPVEDAGRLEPRKHRERARAIASEPSQPIVPAATPSTAIPLTTEVVSTPLVQAGSKDASTSVDSKTIEPPPAPMPAKPALKDGTYYGWGTSRHGDIQASVVIENGRIASASIAQCLTRYSCSWIAHLVPQVVQRQSADVDYVSGATQSTNAFYYAVLEALSKAK